MTGIDAVFVAAFVAGFVGSVHCFAMCGGISGLAAASALEKSLRHQLRLALAYNAGRLLSYAALGALVATAGKTLVTGIPALASPVRIAAGILILLIGLQIAFNLRLLQIIERTGGVVWQKIAPLAKNLLPVSTGTQAIALGLLWGLLPCGLVYSVLLLSASTASPVDGAVAMLAFGAGTLPAMLGTGLTAARLSQWLARRNVRLAAGLLVIIAGILTIAFPAILITVSEPGAAGHHHIG